MYETLLTACTSYTNTDVTFSCRVLSSAIILLFQDKVEWVLMYVNVCVINAPKRKLPQRMIIYNFLRFFNEILEPVTVFTFAPELHENRFRYHKFLANAATPVRLSCISIQYSKLSLVEEIKIQTHSTLVMLNGCIHTLAHGKTHGVVKSLLNTNSSCCYSFGYDGFCAS